MANKGQFQPGHAGGPGRPKGSKNKVTEDFWADFHEVWKARGKKALEAVDDATLVRVAASLVPKESKVELEHSGAIEHRGLPEIGGRVADLLSGRTGSDSSPLLPH